MSLGVEEICQYSEPGLGATDKQGKQKKSWYGLGEAT